MTDKSRPDDEPGPDTRGAAYRRAQQAGEVPEGDANPRGGADKTTIGGRVAAFVRWLLPDDSDEDGEGRTGFLSTRKEWHALVIGVALGLHLAPGVDVPVLVDVIGSASGLRRLQLAKQIPKKYREQIMDELPYALGAGMLAYLGALYGPQIAAGLM